MAISITPGTFQVSPSVFRDSRGAQLCEEHAEPVSDEVKEALKEAIRRLSAVCDGAIKDDGEGFNKSDALWGHKLSYALATGICKLSDPQARYMLKRLRKYKNQLPRNLVQVIWTATQ